MWAFKCVINNVHRGPSFFSPLPEAHHKKTKRKQPNTSAPQSLCSAHSWIIMKDSGRCSKQTLKIKGCKKNKKVFLLFNPAGFKVESLNGPFRTLGVLFSVITVINELLLELFFKEKKKEQSQVLNIHLL